MDDQVTEDAMEYAPIQDRLRWLALNGPLPLRYKQAYEEAADTIDELREAGMHAYEQGRQAGAVIGRTEALSEGIQALRDIQRRHKKNWWERVMHAVQFG